jgi:methylated-DNA-[protein]-cysteine S-methyltransferase
VKLGHVCVEGAGLLVHAWSSRAGLAAVHLGEVPRPATQPGGRPVPAISILEADEALAEFAASLRRYLNGEPLEWEGALDLRGLTDFERRVYEEVRDIPWAETRSYADVARAVGRPTATRAVGNALHRNPLPIVVPCHRVLQAGGGLGGFACGLKVKRKLLMLEAGQIELGLGDEES